MSTPSARINFGLLRPRRVEFIAASHLNECGLACLAMVAEFHDGEWTLADIRRAALHSGRGESLLALRDIGKRLGLMGRGVKTDVEGLKLLATPAILHWRMTHFVVLERVRRAGLVIVDPAGGRMLVPWAEVNTCFTGVALELSPAADWRRRSGRPRRVSIFSYLRPISRWRSEIGLILGLSLLLEILVLLAPLQMRISVDNAVQAGDGRLAWVLAGAFAVIALIQSAVSVVRAWSTQVFSSRFGFELQNRFVEALHAKPPEFFLHHHSADILNRARSVLVVQMLVTGRAMQALLNAAMSTSMFVVLFIATPPLALLVGIFAAINVAATVSLRGAALDGIRRQVHAEADADTLFIENARAARTIRLFGKEDVRIAVWRNRMVDVTNLTLVSNRILMYAQQLALASNSLGSAVVVGAGTYLVITNALTLGTMLMVFVLRGFIVERLDQCVTYVMDLQRVQTHVERIEEVVDVAATARAGEEESPAPVAPFAVPDGEAVRIEARNLWFRYGADTPWVVQDVSFTIEPGECVAITGPSGCGKTTLLNLMLGLLTPTRGEILVNGRALGTIDARDYARVIGVVMQDDALFYGTIADNISFFDAPVDRARVREAATKADIVDEIEAMTMGWYTLLAEGGADISGGQKQRLFIARALYHQPKILFLDEATSHLDGAAERKVNDAVRQLAMTRVIIAHRQETIASAQRVIRLGERGSVVGDDGAAVLVERRPG